MGNPLTYPRKLPSPPVKGQSTRLTSQAKLLKSAMDEVKDHSALSSGKQMTIMFHNQEV